MMNENNSPTLSTKAEGKLAEARRHIDAGTPAQALPLLTEIVDEYPSSARPRTYLGIALSQLKRKDDALEMLNQAISLDGNDPLPLVWRAHLWSSCREVELAYADLTAALRVDPDNSSALLQLGAIKTDEGELDEGEKFLLRAQLLAPEHARIPWYLARLARRRQQPELASRYLDQAIQLDPDEEDSYRLRASIHRAADRLDLALADLEQVVRICPNDESAQLQLDLLRNEQGTPAMTDQVSNSNPSFPKPREIVYTILREHFAPAPLQELAIHGRLFPHRVRADLQRAIDEIMNHFQIQRFLAPKIAHWNANSLTTLMTRPEHDPPVPVAPEYEEIDIGETDPVNCLIRGIWLFDDQGIRAGMYLFAEENYGNVRGTKIEIAVPADENGKTLAKRIFNHLEESIGRSRCYRGKVLSLDVDQHYSGKNTGIRVHKLAAVGRGQVILPEKTVDLLERNVIGFMNRRPQLAALGLSTKKGLLFYGPPGTGKTHTIAFLASSLPDVTTLLITAEQVAILDEYMTLARLLQPSIVVIEDADLIARSREAMKGPCEEVLLNKLLNEMDGLREDAAIFFILTTNRPGVLEEALASRPGRIDQAIEFPRPDANCRRRLIQLYSDRLKLSDEAMHAAVDCSEGVSASFLKELVRRSAQFAFERGSNDEVHLEDIEQALGELLFSGGALNRSILGAEQSPTATS
jgi:cell division protease FtsH